MDLTLPCSKKKTKGTAYIDVPKRGYNLNWVPKKEENWYFHK